MSLSQAFFGLVGAWKAKPVWMAVSRPAVTGQFVFVAMAFACLVYCFVNDDFSVLYVAHNSNSQLPLFYRVAALWGAHEGSLLLWILILSIWSVAVAAFSRALPMSFSSRVLGIMGLDQFRLHALFTLWTSSPFSAAEPPAAQDGADLNPVLQDFALSDPPLPCSIPATWDFPSLSPFVPARRCWKYAAGSSLGQMDPPLDDICVKAVSRPSVSP